jgi:signal transduction histidine kinase
LAVILRKSEKQGNNIATQNSSEPSAVVRKRAMSSQQASEIEKKRFSKELYDDLGQRLSVLKLDMDWLENNLSTADKLNLTRIAQMQGLLDNIIIRTKSIASSLRPPLLDDFGLIPAVNWIAEDFQKKTSVVCEVETSNLTGKFSDPIESAIFRVVQEGLLNVERHARATYVKIRIWHSNKQIEVLIQDNGIGMQAGNENKAGCFGLIAMQERIYTLGGSISISNLGPRGFAIHASIPF